MRHRDSSRHRERLRSRRSDLYRAAEDGSRHDHHRRGRRRCRDDAPRSLWNRGKPEQSANQLAGQSTGNPRIKVYATKVDCVDFSPNQTGACANIGGGGGTLSPTARPCVIDRTCQPEADDIVQNSLTVTHGAGNPEVLGQPAEYKLWVVGDPARHVSYGIEITWFRGPDCRYRLVETCRRFRVSRSRICARGASAIASRHTSPLLSSRQTASVNSGDHSPRRILQASRFST